MVAVLLPGVRYNLARRYEQNRPGLLQLRVSMDSFEGTKGWLVLDTPSGWVGEGCLKSLLKGNRDYLVAANSASVSDNVRHRAKPKEFADV